MNTNLPPRWNSVSFGAGAMTPAERESLSRLDATFARVRAEMDALTLETKKTIGAIDELSAWIAETRRQRGT